MLSSQKSSSENVMCCLGLNLQEQVIVLFGHLLQLTAQPTEKALIDNFVSA